MTLMKAAFEGDELEIREQKWSYEEICGMKFVTVLNCDRYSYVSETGIAYTNDLTKYIIDRSNSSEAVKAQAANPETDIITGLPFKNAAESLTDKEKADGFRKYTGVLGDKEKCRLYIGMMSIPPQEYIQTAVDKTMGSMKRSEMEEMMKQSLIKEMGVDESTVSKYMSGMSDENTFRQVIRR